MAVGEDMARFHIVAVRHRTFDLDADGNDKAVLGDLWQIELDLA